jgi:hypothetical protein
MPEPITNFFKGLTTQHVGVIWVILGAAFWLGEIKPRVTAAESAHNGLKHEVSRIADSLDGFKKEVSEVKSELRVHAVLIASLDEVKKDMKALSTQLTTLSVKQKLPENW